MERKERELSTGGPLFLPRAISSSSEKPKREVFILFMKKNTSSEKQQKEKQRQLSTPPPHPWMASWSVLHSETWCLHVLNFSFFSLLFFVSPKNIKLQFHFISCASTTSIPVGVFSDEIISLRLIYFCLRPSRDNYRALKIYVPVPWEIFFIPAKLMNWKCS